MSLSLALLIITPPTSPENLAAVLAAAVLACSAPIVLSLIQSRRRRTLRFQPLARFETVTEIENPNASTRVPQSATGKFSAACWRTPRFQPLARSETVTEIDNSNASTRVHQSATGKFSAACFATTKRSCGIVREQVAALFAAKAGIGGGKGNGVDSDRDGRFVISVDEGAEEIVESHGDDRDSDEDSDQGSNRDGKAGRGEGAADDVKVGDGQE